MLFDSLVRSSVTWDMDGTRSQMILTETRIGTDNKAPGTPQSQVQKISETKMTTGLSVKRRPSKTGVMKLDSRRWSSKYHAGGSSPFQSVSKVSRPTTASSEIPAKGTKFKRAISMPHIAAFGTPSQ